MKVMKSQRVKGVDWEGVVSSRAWVWVALVFEG